MPHTGPNSVVDTTGALSGKSPVMMRPFPTILAQGKRHVKKRRGGRSGWIYAVVKILASLQIMALLMLFVKWESLINTSSTTSAVPQLLALGSRRTDVTRGDDPSVILVTDDRLQQVADALASFGGMGDLREQDINIRNSILAGKVADLINERLRGSKRLNLKSCFGPSMEVDSVGFALEEECHPSRASIDGWLIVYNSLPLERTWCGETIPPMSAIQFDDLQPCSDYWKNTGFFPPHSIFGPTSSRVIEVKKTKNGRNLRDVSCDVPCRYSKEGWGISSVLYVGGTDWKITHSMEGSHYYPQLQIDNKAHLSNKFYSTTSFQSEIPLPYFSWAEYDINSDPVKYNNVIHGASFMARNCGSKNHREKMVIELQEYFRVDSLSSCLHNAKPPNGLGLQDKKKVMQQYLFHLSFENGITQDYITEKLWGALAAGTVPVFLGSPNIKEHVPHGSVINTLDFETPEALGKYLTKVAANQTLYEQYHEWRKHDFPEAFVKKYNFTHIHSECRTCRWAYAKKYNMGWDHKTQSIVTSKLSSDVCLDDETGMALHPFKEIWMENEKVYEASHTVSEHHCSKIKQHQTFALEHHTIQRSIFEHDNIIDIIIKVANVRKRKSSPLTLRLESILQNNRTYFSYTRPKMNFKKVDGRGQTIRTNMILFQDTISRFTLMFDWKAELKSAEDGVVEISLDSGSNSTSGNQVLLKRLRVIVEDQNQLHYDKNDGTPSYFTDKMITDFFQPLEFFSKAHDKENNNN